MKFSIKNFFSKYDQIRSFLRVSYKYNGFNSQQSYVDRKGRQVVLYLKFYTDNITVSTMFYLLKIQNPTRSIISMWKFL